MGCSLTKLRNQPASKEGVHADERSDTASLTHETEGPKFISAVPGQAKLDMISEDARRVNRAQAAEARQAYLKAEVPKQCELLLQNALRRAETGAVVTTWSLPDYGARACSSLSAEFRISRSKRASI